MTLRLSLVQFVESWRGALINYQSRLCIEPTSVADPGSDSPDPTPPFEKTWIRAGILTLYALFLVEIVFFLFNRIQIWKNYQSRLFIEPTSVADPGSDSHRTPDFLCIFLVEIIGLFVLFKVKIICSYDRNRVFRLNSGLDLILWSRRIRIQS